MTTDWKPDPEPTVVGRTTQTFARTPLASDGRVRLANLRRLVEAADRIGIPSHTVVSGVYDSSMLRDVAIEVRADIDRIENTAEDEAQ